MSFPFAELLSKKAYQRRISSFDKGKSRRRARHVTPGKHYSLCEQSSAPGCRDWKAPGVDYCCGGSKSPEEARLAPAPLAELTKHIRERHHHYVRDAIPRLRALLAKVREEHGYIHREPGLHAFRHTCASLLVEQGISMRPGSSSSDTLIRGSHWRFTVTLLGFQRQAVERLSSVLDISWPQMDTNSSDEDVKGQLIQ